MEKTIVIGCDNAAVELKNTIIALLESKNIPYEDKGVSSSTDVELYPDIAASVCEAIIESNYEKEGILICGTGIGMAMTANKFPGIFAAVCHDSFSAERARLSNDSNVICMGARVIGPELAKKTMIEWLEDRYVPNGSSQPKVDRMYDYDKQFRGER